MAELDLRELDKAKIHRDRVESSSLLVVIREKEIELNASLLEAKKEAEQVVADGRRQSVALHEKAVEEGYQEGQAIFNVELDKAKAEADKIKQDSKAEVKKVKEDGKKNFDKAVEMVLKTVLP